MYEVLVCRPNVFDVTTVDTFGLPECGFCVVCFQTDPLRIRFEETSVSQLSDTELSLTCRVNANVGDIGIRWSVIRSPNGGQPRRVNLTNGDRFNEQRISITENIDVSGISPRAAYTLTSVLVGPNTILEDVQCTVNSPYGSRRSMPRVFQLQGIAIYS